MGLKGEVVCVLGVGKQYLSYVEEQKRQLGKSFVERFGHSLII